MTPAPIQSCTPESRRELAGVLRPEDLPHSGRVPLRPALGGRHALGVEVPRDGREAAVGLGTPLKAIVDDSDLVAAALPLTNEPHPALESGLGSNAGDLTGVLELCRKTLTEIAAEQNSTIVFPLPIELMRMLRGVDSRQRTAGS